MNIDYEKIGQRIRGWRIRKKMTQEQMATLIEREPAYISRIENGRQKPSLDTLLRICCALELDMHTKTPSTKTKIRHLSGGNQQKVILGRWLLLNPDVFLLDDPTRGIDVGAKYEIYQLIFDLAKQNKGVIICSSEMPELLGICDRVLVLSSGHLTGEYDLVHDREHATQENIMVDATKFV